MNLILFDKVQVTNNCFVVSGARFEHLTKVLGVKVGSELRVGQINGKIGHGIVEEIFTTSIKIKLKELSNPAPEPLVDLILALPRPQMLKRILENLPGLGVRKLFLIRSGRVEKSYFDSPVLSPDKMHERLVIGAEQGIVTQLPEVFVYNRFRVFTDEHLDRIIALAPTRMIAHQEGVDIISVCLGGEIYPAIVAIGPEGGWLDHEVQVFKHKGFSCVSLGPRVLRVETAVYSVLSNLAAANEYRLNKK